MDEIICAMGYLICNLTEVRNQMNEFETDIQVWKAENEFEQCVIGLGGHFQCNDKKERYD